MKVLERVLKICLRRKVRVHYGRCVSGGRVSRCTLDGILLAYDNLCLVLAVTDARGEVTRVVVIKKNELESFEPLDREAVEAVLETFLAEDKWS